MRFIGFYDYTVILTYLSLVSAVLGMVCAGKDNFSSAILCSSTILYLCRTGFFRPDPFSGNKKSPVPQHVGTGRIIVPAVPPGLMAMGHPLWHASTCLMLFTKFTLRLPYRFRFRSPSEAHFTAFPTPYSHHLQLSAEFRAVTPLRHRFKIL